MIDIKAVKKAWSLLDRRERRNAWVVLVVAGISALSAAFMVGSLLPFLSVLADPSSIERISQLNWVYERFGFTSSYTFLVALGLLTLGVIVFSNALQLLRVYVITRFCQMRVYSLSRKLLGLYLSQPYEYFLNRHSGDMSTRVLSEVDQTVGGFFRPIIELIAALLTMSTLIILLILVNPAVAIGVFMVFGGTYAAVYFVVRKRLAGLGRQRVKANQARFRAAKEVLTGIKEVKLHGNEDVYLQRYGNACYRTMRTKVTSSLISTVPRYFIQSLAFGGIVVLCLVLLDANTFETDSGSALADLLPLIGVIAFAGQRMMPELSKLYSNLAKMKFGKASVDSVFNDFETAVSTRVSRKTVGEPLPLTSELRFEDVTYRYPSADHDNLHKASVTIRAGERIGIVGSTGAGKTTIADLTLGLLAPTDGRILADGVVIDDATRRQWQRSVAYVPQEIFLVDASIYENIAFGIKPKQIDQARARKAAQLAQLDDFVTSELPQGYDTTIGDRGIRLSGGQRQRIGIARAFYHDASLIVFDEATSALDNLTEREVMAAIDAIPGDKTMLMIAHRLSTVKSCDRIILLNKGHIQGVGTWAELMEENAAFRELAAAA